MRDPDPQALLEAAQSRVRGARALLARPRECNLEECVTLFREAQGYLEWCRDSLAGAGKRPRRGQARAVAGEIFAAGILLEEAARRGKRWLEGLRPPGYTASGMQAALQVRGRISFLG